MYKNILLFLLLINLIPKPGYTQHEWNEMNNTPGKTIKKFNFLNDYLGYAIAFDHTSNSEVIVKTTDGGLSWVTIPSINLSEFMDISFISDSTGFSVYRDMTNSIAPMRIYKTIDDGINWVDISPDTTNTGMGNSVLQFLNENIGFWGVDNVLYKTSDGGNTWDTTFMNNEAIMSMDFIDANSGVIGTWDRSFFYSGSIYTTHDGGNTFDIYNLNLYNSVIHSVNYTNNNTIYASCTDDWFSSGRSPFICKSLDNGNSWDSIPVDTFNIQSATLNAVDFTDELNGLIVLSKQFSDTGYVYKTTDGTISWQFEDTVFLDEILDLEITPNTAYICGEENKIYQRDFPVGIVPITANTYYNNSIFIYPNPIKANGLLNTRSNIDFKKVEIYDISGRFICAKNVVNSQMNTNNLNSGLYYLKMKNSENIASTLLYIE